MKRKGLKKEISNSDIDDEVKRLLIMIVENFSPSAINTETPNESIRSNAPRMRKIKKFTRKHKGKLFAPMELKNKIKKEFQVGRETARDYIDEFKELGILKEDKNGVVVRGE